MIEAIAEFLMLIQDLIFSKKKRLRRKLEKEKNISRKIMVHPETWIFLILLIIIIVSIPTIRQVINNSKKSQTYEKIEFLEDVLLEKKIGFGEYPLTLREITRNNPINKHIINDAWGNEFFYRRFNNGQSYELISKGSDGIVNTKDDVEIK